MLAYLED